MSLKRKKPTAGRARPDANPRPEAAAQKSTVARRPLSGARKRLFVLAALFLPFFLLGLLEAGLRLGGYGYDPAFFRTERAASGKQFLVNNDGFIFRFFPPELARWPGAFRIAVEKPADVKRIFIFGESAAMGDPQPSVGPSPLLEVLLREKFPGQKFEVVNLGITAINSHVILPLAQAVAERGQGDFWIVYMGHNEMVGPFGAASAFGDRAAPLPWVRFSLAMQKTRVGQLAVATRRRFGRAASPSGWGGMGMFMENQISPHDARREAVYQNFGHNLRDILAAGQRSGAKVLVNTVSVNLRDCPPFSSLLNRNLSTADRARFDALYARACEAQTNQQFAAAAAGFELAAQLDPAFAELQFRWAQCLENGTNAPSARAHFQRACDVDALPFRADTEINQLIRAVAQERAGVNLQLCDAEAVLAATAPGGTAGDESFFEHVHFNFDGNYRLARAWAEQVADQLPGELMPGASNAWATQAFCERAVGLSDWNRRLVISSVLSRMRLPPLSGQLNNAVRMDALEAKLRAVAERQRLTGNPAQVRADFAAAMARAPQDVFLLENYGKVLELLDDLPGALVMQEKILERLPHDFKGAVQAGRLLGRLKRFSEAEAWLRPATRQRPTLPDPWFELGVVLAAGARYAEALDCFERVLQMHPADVTCLVNRARMLSQLKRRAEAIGTYRTVIQLNKDSWEAHVELAGELAATDAAAESLQEYLAAVRLNPRHAMVRVNLGVMLARQNRLDEAIQQFEAALSLDSTNAAAAEYLRQVTVRRNQLR